MTWIKERVRHSNAKKFGKAGGAYKKKKKTIHITKITPKTKYVSEEGFEFEFEPVEDTVTVEETKDGYTARYLVRDDSGESPEAWDDEYAFLVHYHRDFEIHKDDIITEDDASRLAQGEKIDQQKDYYIFPVEAYIHGGVSLTLSSFQGMLPQGHYEFDTSRVGLVLVNKKEVKTKKQAQARAEGLVESWNLYLSGDVYGTVIEKYNKNKIQTSQDATWGYYGYKDAMKELKTYEG